MQYKGFKYSQIQVKLSCFPFRPLSLPALTPAEVFCMQWIDRVN